MWRDSDSPTYGGDVSLGGGAILCDFEGCWNALVVSNPLERFAPPVNDIIQHRAWCKGWTTDEQDRDLCSRHSRGRT